MDSSSASRSTTEARYRSGSSGQFTILPSSATCHCYQTTTTNKFVAGYYTDVKELKGSRGGPNLVVVKHDRGNPDRDEPRSYSGGSYSKTAKNRS